MAAAVLDNIAAAIKDGGGDSQTNPDGYDDYENATGSSGCGCFGRFCRNRGNGYLRWPQDEEIRENWPTKAAKKLREVSEVLAGPKWKNFIRRFGINRKRKTNFQYDPQSYALNFDEGINRGEDEIPPPFSSRFAAPIGTR